MNHPWKKPLTEQQSGHPFSDCAEVALPQTMWQPSDADMRRIFPRDTHSLKTWGRTPGTKADDPHWIAVHKATPLHTDPAYPQWTHHLLLRVDAMALRGFDRTPLIIRRGSYLRLDGHSPHQLYGLTKNAGYYLAVSMDSDVPLGMEVVVPRLLAYAAVAEVWTDDLA